MEHVSIIDLAPVIKRKLDVFEETNLNTFTLKELDILIDEVIDDIYIDFNKPENRYLLDDENENFFDNMISKFTCLKSQILESFPEEIKNNFEYISSINVEVSNINEKVYEYEYYYDSVIHEEVGCSDSGNRIYKLEDLNYEYYLGLEDLNYYEKMYTNYFKISYIKELWNANKHMILYSITNKDDNTQGYIAIERASEEINTEYMVNTNLYDNDEKHLMYSPKNIGRVLTVLGLYFNTFRHEYEIVRKLTEEELIKILNRAEDEHKYYSL